MTTQEPTSPTWPPGLVWRCGPYYLGRCTVALSIPRLGDRIALEDGLSGLHRYEVSSITRWYDPLQDKPLPHAQVARFRLGDEILGQCLGGTEPLPGERVAFLPSGQWWQVATVERWFGSAGPQSSLAWRTGDMIVVLRPLQGMAPTAPDLPFRRSGEIVVDLAEYVEHR
jgi:hypothetical protein